MNGTPKRTPTLKFRQNIRKIELGPAKKHQSKMPPPPKGKKKK